MAQAEYRAALKLIPRNGRYLVWEELPKKYQRMLKEKRKRQKKKYLAVKSIWDLDPKIWLHKYYPWCYNEYIPTLVLQGWYDENKAKKAYLRTYGPQALKYVKFIKGKDALERDFKIGHNLYINGRWRYIPGKSSMFPTKYGGFQTVIEVTRKIPGANPHLKRKHLDKEIPYYQNGSREIIFKNKPIKKARLQKAKSIDNERKKSLYIED